jgi:hypothetical protein
MQAISSVEKDRSIPGEKFCHDSTHGFLSAIKHPMLSRMTGTCLLVVALLLATFTSPAWSCSMQGQPQNQPMTCGGSCCAAMKCCTPATEGPRSSQASANSTVSKNVVVAIAPLVTAPRSELLTPGHSLISVLPTCQKHVISPLAVSCIRLI